MKNKITNLVFLLFFIKLSYGQVYESPPYSTGFESGLGAEWTTNTTNYTSYVVINSNQTPRTGTRHLSFAGTIWWPQNYSINSAMLHLDLDSSINVNLSFWMEDYTEENHSENGIYFSDDGGSNYVKVMNYNGGNFINDVYYKFTLDITALAMANGLSLTSTFIIKFQQYGYEPISSDGISIDDISITQISALPISLLDFHTEIIEPNKIEIKWQTASELNNDYFTIERSKNGFDWKELIKIDGAGNSSSLLSYSTIDNSPFNGVSYYRLKQTDFDGKFEYFQIRSVNIKQLINSEIEIYPNPATNQLIIKGSSNELKEIVIYNALGQNVTSLNKQVMTNENQFVIDITKLNAGMYYVKTKTTANKVYKK